MTKPQEIDRVDRRTPVMTFAYMVQHRNRMGVCLACHFWPCCCAWVPPDVAARREVSK